MQPDAIGEPNQELKCWNWSVLLLNKTVGSAITNKTIDTLWTFMQYDPDSKLVFRYPD